MNAVVKKLGLWFYGLVAAALGSVGSVGGAYIGGKVFGAADFTLRQLGAVCAGGAIVAILAYLKQSPLPKIDDSAASAQPPAATPAP